MDESVSIIVFSVTATVIVIGLISLLIIKLRRRRQQHRKLSGHPKDYHGTHTSSALISLGKSPFESMRQVPVDYTIPRSHIEVVSVLGKDQSGLTTSVASYGEEKVLLKQFATESSAQADELEAFMKKIHVYSTFSHPNLVKFFGVTSNTPLDVSAIFSYMEHSDLRSLLNHMNKNPQEKEDFDWFPSGNDPSSVHKAGIAADIADALDFLHSRKRPMLVGHLTSSKIYLGSSYEACLCPMDLTNKLDLNQLFSQPWGSIAWTAPEVLQGEPCTNKSDVYSFGIILSELDTCEVPFVASKEEVPACSQTNASLALRIGAGLLCPSFTISCPDKIKNLAFQCLRLHPAERPTAAQVSNQLSRIYEDYMQMVSVQVDTQEDEDLRISRDQSYHSIEC